MEINDIKIFVQVAKLSSTSKAAETLGYVQSNVSKRISKLECELGKKLFIRSNKGMTLTKDGEVFLSYGQEILMTIAKMEEVFLNNKSKINIGATQSISNNYLREYCLNGEGSLFTRPMKELIRLLENEEVDFIIVNRRLENKKFEKIKSFSETVYWAQSKMNNLNFEENKVIVSRDIECPYRIETFEYFKRNKVKAKEVIEIDTLDVLVVMVESNKAIAMLSEKTINLNNNIERIKGLESTEIEIYIYKLSSNKKMFSEIIN